KQSKCDGFICGIGGALSVSLGVTRVSVQAEKLGFSTASIISEGNVQPARFLPSVQVSPTYPYQNILDTLMPTLLRNYKRTLRLS
ncbi:hypothetical protein ACFLUZ_02955, partial [Chloroflexota bacterium]